MWVPFIQRILVWKGKERGREDDPFIVVDDMERRVMASVEWRMALTTIWIVRDLELLDNKTFGIPTAHPQREGTVREEYATITNRVIVVVGMRADFCMWITSNELIVIIDISLTLLEGWVK